MSCQINANAKSLCVNNLLVVVGGVELMLPSLWFILSTHVVKKHAVKYTCVWKSGLR